MSCKKTIRSLFAVLLLALFALNVTPKHWLHLVVTGHMHHALSKADGVGYQKSKTGFNCSCEDQFTESPFDAFPVFDLDLQLRAYSAYFETLSTELITVQVHHSSLRGPPAVV